MEKRTYLTILPETKKDALLVEYDKSQKLWFVKAEAHLEKVKAWLPENTVTDQAQWVRTRNFTTFADIRNCTFAGRSFLHVQN
ncbi:hypothetical protein Q6I31_004276 [Salmonella enterica]|nr:hypothetical protein [Salmonella enterica subsp. enterica serovar Newport]ELG7317114.1 hypothetical protein [Salmonella enterica]